MKVCFYGTAEEIEQVASRPIVALFGFYPLPSLLIFDLTHLHVTHDPYNAGARLCGDLTDTKGSERD